MLTKKYLQEELARRIKGIKPNVPTNTDVLIGELKSALMMVDCLPDDTLEESEKPVSNDLKEAAEEHSFNYDSTIYYVLESSNQKTIWKMEIEQAFKAGAEWRDRMLNWARDLVQAGIDKPEEAVNILKRLKDLL